MGGITGNDAFDPLAEPSGPRLGQITDKQRRSECLLALRLMKGVLAPILEVGTQVDFKFWFNQGALTMVGWQRTTGGPPIDATANLDTFGSTLRDLPTLLKGSPRYVHFTTHRDANGWAEPSIRSEDAVAPPPEAKALPEDTPQVSDRVLRPLEREAGQKWVRLLQAPENGAARLKLTVEFDDDRLMNSTPGRYEAMGSGALVQAPPGFELELANDLVPLAQGLGHRKVEVFLLATRAPGDARPVWKVIQVTTLHPKQDEGSEPFTTAADYRQLHEEIIRNWREETAAAAIMAVSFTAEQFAVWVVGGWAAHGAGAVLEVAAGPVLRVLGRGGPAAADWLYCLLRRVPDPERKALAELWAKAETQGFKALEASEQARLRAAFQQLSELAETPLTRDDKKTFRKIAGDRLRPYLKDIDPDLLLKLVDETGRPYPVHHRVVLEYAHLFPELDINAISNLAAVHKEVHASIGRIWTELRISDLEVTPTTVREVAAIVDRNYGRWYNAVYDKAQHFDQLQAAERTAMAQLRALLAR